MSTQATLADELRRIVLRRIEENTLDLPALRSSVVQCLALLQKDDFSFKQAAQIVEQDPVLSGRILWLSNSAAYGGLEPNRSVLAAITRLGATSLRTALVEASVHQVFESKNPRIAVACRGLWIHSRAVALLAREIGVRMELKAPDDAYVGGLLHDVGKPVLAALLLRSEHRLRLMAETWFEAEDWIEIIELSHRPIGAALAATWRLSGAVSSVIGNCTEYDASEPRSIANCVRLANAVAKDLGLYVGNVDRSANDGVIRVGQLMLGIETAEVNRMRDELRTRLIASSD